MTRTVLLVLFLSFLSAVSPLRAAPVRPGSPADDANRIVAVVNEEIVTQSELNRVLVPAYLQLQSTLSPEELSKEMEKLRGQVLDQMIDEKLMLQEAKNPRPVEVSKGRIGTPPVITSSDEEADEMLKDVRARFPTPEVFEETMGQYGMTLEGLKERFRNQVIIQKLIGRDVRSRVSVSPAEITTFYESRPQEFASPPAAQVATLVIRPKDTEDIPRAFAQAQDLHRQISKGADFYELARKYSDGFNAKMGGRMGYLEKGKNLKEIEDVLFLLKAGELSPVIKTPAGFHLFLVESVRPSRQATLEEAQAEIRFRLIQQKTAERYKQWIAKLRAESYITLK